ncbi:MULTISPECIES: hypothetical protein [unclassified Crossiella]|uniref:hypothetical protein n=1 Tax=unclassified Crossiella TaxID=2620835 RepID=UPI001FFED818|nr:MULTISPECIES: hypothetical protein [unclassified Crossiella]MCK2241839.1 hypothetical protein [Crossiella sp. S99.2]MCK2255742.1 hypothetical protein [Crossiella sp. S99.1]
MTTAMAAAVRAASTTVAGSVPLADASRVETAVVRMFGFTVGLVYEPDAVEVPRRAGYADQPDAPSMAFLDTLMNLPVDQPVALRDLTERQRQHLRAAPPLTVEVDRHHVTRLAVAPVRTRFALVAAKDWATGLKRAGRFTPFCAKALVLRALPADSSDLLMRASFYGTGVCVFDGHELDMVVEPCRYVRKRHTPAHWWFEEEVYARIRA